MGRTLARRLLEVGGESRLGQLGPGDLRLLLVLDVDGLDGGRLKLGRPHRKGPALISDPFSVKLT